MNIVILSDMLPFPLNSGGAQAVFNMLDSLRASHQITFVFPESQSNSMANKNELQKMLPEVVFKCYPYWRQLLNWNFLKDKAVRALRIWFAPNGKRLLLDRALKPYCIYFSCDFNHYLNSVIRNANADIFQAEFYNCLPAVNHISEDVKTVFVHHEIRFVRNERLLQSVGLTQKEVLMKDNSKKEELANLNKYDVVVTLTDKDKEILCKNGVTTHIEVSPAAINTTPVQYSEWKGNVTFLGNYSHLPNREGLDWFAKKVLPLMGDNVGKQVSVIGSNWSEDYANKYGFVLKGFVEKLSDEVCGTVMIVPLLTGSGMRMKILEAAATHVPFITTSVGVEGLLFENERDCIVADSPEAFADGLERLMNEEELRKRLASHAHSVFMENYSVKKLAAVRNGVYNRL